MLPQIERYEITDEIGHGGMATVYRARDTRLDRWVAVKVMHPHLRGTEQGRARFSREARAVARLRHPSILEIYDYSGSDSEDAYIATELLTGPTLKAFVEQVPEMPAEIVACIGVCLAQALSAAHAEGIVHRDVKPENVLLHENRTLKLTDFGVADMLDPSMSTMTATGQILGSPAHMAPEQIEGGDADGRSDLFSLGTILYWLATGALPFSGRNPHQVLKRVVEDEPMDPLRARPAVGHPLRNVILRCLRKRPEDRFESADELAAALREVLRQVDVVKPEATLEAYLQDPATEAARLTQQAIAALLRTARSHVKARDRQAALQQLDRVLSLEDGNAQALSLLAELDRRANKWRYLHVALALGALGGLLGLWLRFGAASDAGSGFGEVVQDGPERPTGSAQPPRTALSELPAEAQPQSDFRDAAAQTAARRVAAPDAAAPGPRERSPEPGALAAGTGPGERDPSDRPPRPRSKEPRVVVFDPEPANVSIGVDGEPPRPFGPSFRSAELAPGPHTFRFVGAHACCQDLVLRVEIPAGPGETLVPAKLKFRDARVYVASQVPADVQIDGKSVGRARSVLSVPIERTLQERHEISVTAPGHEPYRGSVQLRAGKVTQLEVSLKPRASP